MPGLIGIFRPSGVTEEDQCRLKRHVEQYSQSGRFHCEFLRLPNLLVAHSYTEDLPHHPFSEEHGILVGLHGEIYLDSPACESPVDYIREAYLKYGEHFAAELNGSFSIVIHDSAKQTTYLTNDHVGSQPVAYHQTKSGALIFAPELKSILALGDTDFRVDLRAVADIFSSGYVIDRKTLVKDVNLMNQAAVLKVSNAGLRESRYWDFELTEDEIDQDVSGYRQTLSELLVQAVARQQRSTHRGECALLLSGGLDSRAILGAARACGYDIRTVGYGFELTKWADASVSAKVSEIAGVSNHFHQCRLDEYVNYEDSSAFFYDGMRERCHEWPIWSTLREEQGINVLMTGEECFGRHSQVRLDELDNNEIRRFDPRALYSRVLNRQSIDMLGAASKESAESVLARSSLRNYQNRKDYFYWDQRLFCNTLRIRYSQQTASAVRTPWLDRDILRFMCTVPPQFRSDKNLFGATARDAWPDLFAVPLVATTNRPLASQRLRWLRRCRDEFKSELLDGQSPIDQLFEANATETMVDYLESRLVSAAQRDRVEKLAGKFGGNWVRPAGRLYSAVDRLKHQAASGTMRPPRSIEVFQTLERIINLRHALRDVRL